MLRERLLVTLLLLPILIWIIARGGWLFGGAVALVLGLAAAEYGLLFRNAGLRPSLQLLVLGVALLILARVDLPLEWQALTLTGLTLIALTWHLLDYERGALHSATDFAVSVSGIVYLGWIGGYLVLLRSLPEGQWWILIALPAVWIADSAAYLVGSWKGKRPLTPRLSPKKTWEGYLAGVVFGGAAGAGLAGLWRIGAGPDSGLTVIRGLIVGGLIAILSPLGDLGISMIKRQMKVKDTGTLFAAHGGALDRLDSWLWAGVLGYYAVGWLTRGA